MNSFDIKNDQELRKRLGIRSWNGIWINSGKVMYEPSETVEPAPFFRKTFDWTPNGLPVKGFLCGLGWHELHVNGRKIGTQVLTPVVSQYNSRSSYVEYDLTPYLVPGKNTVAVILGNGWYNCHSTSTWNLDTVPWRDWPKLLFEAVSGEHVVVKSDSSWKWNTGPILFDALRNGEKYDARLELADFSEPDYDDSGWRNAVPCLPPGGLIVREDAPPCAVQKVYPSVKKYLVGAGEIVYDFGTNLTGWCRLEASGGQGAEIQITYGERIRENGTLDFAEIAGARLKNGEQFQTDYYFFKGGGTETFHPRFTYHGFRYARVRFWSPTVVIHKIEAMFIHSTLGECGTFESSSKVLNRLQTITRQSYLCNFTGIPTDCPHREKLGWTNDTQLACETGLWNFDGRDGYRHFLRMLSDAQRPNGQLPAIVPTGGWGFCSFSGPINDNILFEVVRLVYLFYGDADFVREFYGNMAALLEYYGTMLEDGLLRFGLGDWAPWNSFDVPEIEVTSSGYYYGMARDMARFAEAIERKYDASEYSALAEKIKDAYQKKYGDIRTDRSGAITSFASDLYFGLAKNPSDMAAELADRVRKQAHKAVFGILGAKFTPRVLADWGYADDAFRVLTQSELPGWGHWVQKGATTLREQWNSSASQNHIMFGDVSAWMFRYAAGMSPVFEAPGFRKCCFNPCFVKGLDSCSAEHVTPFGKVCSSWKRIGKKIQCGFTVPEGCSAELVLDGENIILDAGFHGFSTEKDH